MGSLKAERDEAVARMAQLTPRLEATNRELMVATAAAKAAASEVEALEGELDEVQSTIEGLRSGGKAYATEAAVVARLEQQLQEKRSQVEQLRQEVKALADDRDAAVAAKVAQVGAVEQQLASAQRATQSMKLNMDAVHRQLKQDQAAAPDMHAQCTVLVVNRLQ